MTAAEAGLAEHTPLSGYAVLAVYSTEQVLREQAADPDGDNHEAIQFGWDWRWIEPRVFEVRISIAVEPSSSRPQYVAVNVIGRFRQVIDEPRIQIAEFVRLQAVAILLPYARQFISAITGTSFFGAYFLPTMNVVSLMEGFDASKATAMQQGDGKTQVPRAVMTPKRIRRSANKKK